LFEIATQHSDFGRFLKTCVIQVFQKRCRDTMKHSVDASLGVIGPNAILQLAPVIERFGGHDRLQHMMAQAGLFELPDGLSMIPEGNAARLHRQLRTEEPALAPVLSAEAGRRTADYILAHRIPAPAQRLLCALPPALAAWALSKAIAQHAWTFAGSGAFRARSAWVFEIAANPLVRGEVSATPLCAWHAAVFEGLYRTLVAPDCQCREVSCCAQAPGTPCRFEIRRRPGSDASAVSAAPADRAHR